MEYTRRTILTPLLLATLPLFSSEASATSLEQYHSSFGIPAAFAFSAPSGKGDESNDSKIEKKNSKDAPRLNDDGIGINGAAANGNMINGSSNDALNDVGGSYMLQSSSKPIAYQTLSVKVMNQVNVPVAVWYPAELKDDKNMDINAKKSLIMDFPKLENIDQTFSNNDKANSNRYKGVTYPYRVSVKKIGNMLAGWDFIPEFVSKDFTLNPTLLSNSVVDGLSLNIPIPQNGPLILLAHGFLGSRYDLSHLAEQLALKGFTCMSPEFPESLASSYPAVDGLDRAKIVDVLLKVVSDDLKITPSSYGIVGHSLGCGTVMTTGDDSWTRVCLAGPPVRRDGVEVGGSTLVLTSVNDGAVTMARIGNMIPSDFERLDETNLPKELPKKAALIFDRPDAPNHISFLTDSTNRSMIQFLSPFLPVAKAMNIPVLDFDKYKESQDSKETAAVVIPLVSSFLQQNMKF